MVFEQGLKALHPDLPWAGTETDRQTDRLVLVRAFEITKPTLRDICPPSRTHFLILPTQFISWRLSRQISEPLGAILIQTTTVSQVKHRESIFQSSQLIHTS